MDDNEHLAYLGPGYTLFFVFIKYAIAFLTIFFLVIGIYELVSNYNGTHCSSDPACYHGYAIILSIYNKADDPESLGIQQWLNLALMFIMIIMIQLMRRQKRRTAADCDERDISTSDYTILVENIPNYKDMNLMEKLKRLFEELPPIEKTGGKTPFKVMKIILTYNLSELNK